MGWLTRALTSGVFSTGRFSAANSECGEEMTQVYNFSSGPAMLPVEVLRRAEQELCNWHGLGTSVMEISHRSKEFIAVAEQAEQDLRDLLKVPPTIKCCFATARARSSPRCR